MKTFKFVLYFIFISGVILSLFFIHVLDTHVKLFEMLFSVSIAGLVGIGTNTIAIKMLFRPLEKTFFGRQGIIPKNREKIAHSLSKAVRERIINENSIAEFVFEEEKIEELSKKLSFYIESILKREESRERIKKLIKNFKKSSIKDEIFDDISKLIEKHIEEFFSSDKISFSSMFLKLRSFLRQIKRKDEVYVEIVENLKWIIKELIKRSSNEISEKLNELIDSFLRKKLLGLPLLLKKAFVSDEYIVKELREFLEDEEKLKMTGDFFQILLGKLDSLLDERETKEKLFKLYVVMKAKLLLYIKEKGVVEVLNSIEKFIDDLTASKEELHKFITKVEGYTKQVLNSFFGFLKTRFTPNDLKNFLEELKLGDIVYSIVYRNIMKQSLEEFEELTQRIMGENLSYIEVVGGILGMLIGISLTYRIALIFVPAGIGLFLIVDWVFTKKFKDSFTKPESEE